MSNPIKICNAASVLLGAGVVQSLEDDTDLSRIFANTYDMLKRSIMSAYPWTFLKEDHYLTRRSGVPLRGFQYAYIIPGEAMAGNPHAVFSYQGQRLGSSDYRMSSGGVLCNYSELWATLIINKPESDWPPYFQQAVIHALAGAVALAVTDQQSIADRHYQMAYGTPSQEGVGGLIGQAMLLDSQGDGVKAIESDFFVNARLGAWTPWGRI